MINNKIYCAVCKEAGHDILPPHRLVGKECYCVFDCHDSCWLAALTAMRGGQYLW